MANELRGKFSVLIISPYKKQSLQICNALKSKGLQNLDYETKDADKLDVFDGFRILLNDKHDNLGWRIVAKFFMHAMKLHEIVIKSNESPNISFEEIFPDELKKKIKDYLNLLNYISKNKQINENNLIEFFNSIEINRNEILVSHSSNKPKINYL